ncbi:MAG: hypothetical protein AB7E05_05700 [Sphingobium sp.]
MWRSPLNAAVLCAGALLAGIMTAGQAGAKDEPGNTLSATPEFRTGAEQARASLKAGDVTGAGGRISALNAVTPFEKYMKASLAMELAVKRNDIVAQRKAVAELIESGGTPREELPHLNHIAGYLCYQTGAIDNAVVYLTRARELGVTEPQAALLLVESYMRKRKLDDAAQLLDQTIAAQQQAGKAVPPSWYDRASAIAIGRKDWNALARYNSAKLAGMQISAPEWRTALVGYTENARPDKEALIDLYRLQAATGALASERDYQGYAALAAGQGYAAEAKSVIDTGTSEGKLQSNDPVATPLLRTVKPRAVTYLASIKGLPGKASSAASGAKAEQGGDKLLASAQYADAVPYYRTALEKGVDDKDRVSTRLGIALARSGDFNGAKAALAQVASNGAWGQVAAFWAAWVEARQAGTERVAAAPTPASATAPASPAPTPATPAK